MEGFALYCGRPDLSNSFERQANGLVVEAEPGLAESGHGLRRGRDQAGVPASASISSAPYWKGETPKRPSASRNSLLEIPAISAALPCETSLSSYHLTAAASRNSSAKP